MEAFIFVRNNIKTIITGLLVALIFYLAVYISLNSLKKLKIDFSAYYPFDRFFPQSGKWSSLYFLTLILFLGLIIFFIVKGAFYLSPA